MLLKLFNDRNAEVTRATNDEDLNNATPWQLRLRS